MFFAKRYREVLERAREGKTHPLRHEAHLLNHAGARIGVDLGGTKIEGILLERDGRISQRLRVATPQGDYAATITAVCDLVLQLQQLANDRCPVGVGTPGAIAPHNGLMQNCNSTCLNGKPLREDLSQRVGQPVRLANDADCMVLSEASDGAAAGDNCVFGVIIGTGVGGGLVVNGGLVSGPNAIAGEWGHNALPWPADHERPGRRCYCGQSGCIETFLSGPGLVADFQASGGNPRYTAADIAAATSDPIAASALETYCQRLAKALASVINVLDPHCIVLAGGLSNIDRLYARVPELWGEWIFSAAPRTRLVRAQHGDSSGVRGAAWLWD